MRSKASRERWKLKWHYLKAMLKVGRRKEIDVGVKWFRTEYYPKHYQARAVHFEDKVLPRLRQSEITFFTPWGPPYWFVPETYGACAPFAISQPYLRDQEINALQAVANIFADLKNNMPGKKFRWLLVGADTYGTRINGMPEWIAKNYFDHLEHEAVKMIPNTEFCLWSGFDKEAEGYRASVREEFSRLVNPQIFRRAKLTTERMGRGSDAKEYLVERLAEAMLIEDRFKPIKLSMVGRHKDEYVDHELPRLYFLPEQHQVPWL